MKLSERELRSIVRSVIKEAEDGKRATLDDTVELVSSGICFLIEQALTSDHAASDVIEQVMGTVPDEELMRPVRFEDVDHYASRIADDCLKHVREQVEQLANRVLRSLMAPG